MTRELSAGDDTEKNFLLSLANAENGVDDGGSRQSQRRGAKFAHVPPVGNFAYVSTGPANKLR